MYIVTTPFWVMGDEILLNAGKEIVHQFFDQNRLIFSPTIQLNDHWRFSVTSSNHFASTSTPGNYTYTHVLLLRMMHNLDLPQQSAAR